MMQTSLKQRLKEQDIRSKKDSVKEKLLEMKLSSFFGIGIAANTIVVSLNINNTSSQEDAKVISKEFPDVSVRFGQGIEEIVLK